MANATKSHDTYLAEINTVEELISQKKAINDAESNLEKLKASNLGDELKASIDGKILSINIKTGDITSPETGIMVIQGNTEGFTLSFSVTMAQSKKVAIGDVATISDSWYFDGVTATLKNIKNDPEMPGKQKILVFNISGEVEVGTSMSLSLGEKSATYDYVVPNSAIREDNNGNFILIVKQKSSPLGNRYIAQRVGVEIVVSDDSKTAVNGAIEGGEYVITTSNKMIKPGDYVRLAD